MAAINQSLVGKAAAALHRLKFAHLSLVTAESCTAGLLAAALSRAEGAGQLLQGGFVTYTKDQKSRALGISKRLLAKKAASLPGLPRQ